MVDKKRKKPGDDMPTVARMVDPAQLVFAGKEPMLEQVKGPGSPRRHTIHDSSVVFGRSDKADIIIDSDAISRRHLKVTRSGAKVRCEDLNSANGLYLNGVKIHGADLHDGDTLQIGDVVLVFRED